MSLNDPSKIKRQWPKIWIFQSLIVSYVSLFGYSSKAHLLPTDPAPTLGPNLPASCHSTFKKDPTLLEGDLQRITGQAINPGRDFSENRFVLRFSTEGLLPETAHGASNQFLMQFLYSPMPTDPVYARQLAIDRLKLKPWTADFLNRITTLNVAGDMIHDFQVAHLDAIKSFIIEASFKSLEQLELLVRATRPERVARVFSGAHLTQNALAEMNSWIPVLLPVLKDDEKVAFTIVSKVQARRFAPIDEHGTLQKFLNPSNQPYFFVDLVRTDAPEQDSEHIVALTAKEFIHAFSDLFPKLKSVLSHGP